MGYTWVYAGSFVAHTKMASEMPQAPPRGNKNPEQYLTKEQQKACLKLACAELIISQPCPGSDEIRGVETLAKKSVDLAEL